MRLNRSVSLLYWAVISLESSWQQYKAIFETFIVFETKISTTFFKLHKRRLNLFVTFNTLDIFGIATVSFFGLLPLSGVATAYSYSIDVKMRHSRSDAS